MGIPKTLSTQALLMVTLCAATQADTRFGATTWNYTPNSDGLRSAKLLVNTSQARIGNYRFAGEFMDACSTLNDCRKFAYQCSKRNVCECAEGYRPDEKRETCVGGIDAKCMYDSHCVTRAYCKGQQTCTCKLEFPITSSDKWTCYGSGSQPVLTRLPATAIFLLVSSGIWMFRYF